MSVRKKLPSPSGQSHQPIQVEAHVERRARLAAPAPEITVARRELVILHSDREAAAQMSETLTRSGYPVAAISDIHSAESLVERLNPALVILDLLSGEDFPQGLGTHGSTQRPAVAVLVLIVDKTSKKFRAVINAASDGYLVKPLDGAGLLGMAQAILIRTGSELAVTDSDPLDALFRAAVAQHEAFVISVVSRFGWDGADIVPELVDDTLFALWQQFPKFVRYDAGLQMFLLGLPGEELRHWLAATARHRCESRRRSDGRHLARLDHYAQHVALTLPGGVAPNNISELEADDLLARARGTLSDRDVAIVRAVSVEGSSPADVAVIHHVSLGRLRNVLSESLQKMRAVLGGSRRE